MENLLMELSWIEAIKLAKAQYCRFVDRKMWNELNNLFCDHVILTFYDTEENILYQFNSGADFVDACLILEEATTIHHVHNAEIELLDLTTAKATFSMEDHIYFDQDAESPFKVHHGYGFYYSIYEKLQDGWKIRELKLKRQKLDVT